MAAGTGEGKRRERSPTPSYRGLTEGNDMTHDRKSAISILRTAICGFAIAVLFVTSATAGDEEKPAVTGRNSKIQLSGVGWATYRYQLQRDTHSASDGRHLTTLATKDMNLFDVDRVYLTGDYAFDDRYNWQTTIEMTNVAGDPRIYVKRAFLKIKSPFAIANTFVQMGQIAHVMTPSVEKVWGYRSVAKIGIDRYLGISTTWNGLGFGFTGGQGLVDAEFAVANENAYNKITATKYKTFQGRVTLTPLPTDEALKGLKIALWGQMNSSAPPSGFQPKAADNTNMWLGVFPSFQASKLTVAGEFEMKKDKTPSLAGAPPTEEVTTKTSRLLSGWVAYDVTARVRAFARLEQYDPNTDKDIAGDALTTLNAGVSHNMVKGVRSIIDLEYTKFQEPKTAPATWKKLDSDMTLSARLEVSL